MNINQAIAEALSGEKLDDWIKGDDLLNKTSEDIAIFLEFLEDGMVFVHFADWRLDVYGKWHVSECVNISSRLRDESHDISTLWD